MTAEEILKILLKQYGNPEDFALNEWFFPDLLDSMRLKICRDDSLKSEITYRDIKEALKKAGS